MFQCHITFSLIYLQNLIPQLFETELNQKILLYRLEALFYGNGILKEWHDDQDERLCMALLLLART